MLMNRVSIPLRLSHLHRRHIHTIALRSTASTSSIHAQNSFSTSSILKRPNESPSSSPSSSSPSSSSNIVFPWRENSSSKPPSRIGTLNDLSGFNNTPNSRFSLKVACAVELKEFTLWSFFISKQWETELASNASWAFQTAVSGLVSRTFGIPLHLMENTLEDGLVVETTTGGSVKNNTGSVVTPLSATAGGTAGSTATSTNINQSQKHPLTVALEGMKANHSNAEYTTALTTISKILSNIISNPHEEKYRKVQPSDPELTKRLGRLTNSHDAMTSIGFVSTKLSEGNYEYSLVPSSEAWTNLTACKKIIDGMIQTNNEDVEDSSEFIQNMIESNLLSLYKPIHESNNNNDKNNNKQYQVTFCLKPISSKLENIFMIPSLTRQDVEHNPSLKGAYLAIDKAWKEKASVEEIGDMSKELTRKTSHFGTKRSIIMDVAIDCAEIFQIKDLSSGKIIQGQGKKKKNDDNKEEQEFNDLDLEPEMTTHLVRFEMVTSKGQRAGERKLGSWIVIDIDDMLNGNTWH